MYAKSSKQQDYYYFMKLVPHIFLDEVWDEEYQSYSYSLNHQFKVRSRADGQIAKVLYLPFIRIIYDFTPVTMKIVKEQKSLGHFLTHVCAIIGGVFVIFGLLNRTILRAFDVITKNDNQ